MRNCKRSVLEGMHARNSFMYLILGSKEWPVEGSWEIKSCPTGKLPYRMWHML
jgi:hypothetical protein